MTTERRGGEATTADPRWSDGDYDGAAGRTRLRTVRVPDAAGNLTPVEVVAAVNARSHPELAAAARAGVAHAGTPAADLALPFVFHDPDRRKLALVLPPALAHEALERRGRLLLELAEEEGPLPAYAREATTVVGARALEEYLASSDPSEDASASGLTLRARREMLQLREARLLARAEALSRREATLDRRLGSSSYPPAAPSPAAEDRSPRAPASASIGAAYGDGERWGEGVGDAAGSGAAVPTGIPAYTSDAIELLEDDLPGDAEPIGDDEVEVVAEDLVATSSGFLAPERVGTSTPPPLRAPTPDTLPDEALPATPAAWNEGAAGPDALVWRPEDGMVQVLLRLRRSEAEAFAHAPPELLVQLAWSADRPVALLTVVSTAGGAPVVARAPLDPTSVGDRTLLGDLADRFEAEVVLCGLRGLPRQVIAVSAEREGNVGRLLERTAETPPGELWPALDAVLADPPPLPDGSEPFGTAAPVVDARQALDRLRAVAPWAEADRFEHAALTLSTPLPTLEGALREALGDALRFGLALEPPWVEAALQLGVRLEERALVEDQLAGLLATVREDGGGLTPSELGLQVERGLRAAARMELPLEAQDEDALWSALRAAHPDLDDGELDPTDLEGAKDVVLRLLLAHREHRLPAALEVCRRGDTALLGPLVDALPRLSPDEIERLAPRLLDLGLPAGDALVPGLEARAEAVRQAALLVVGELRPPAALPTLVRRVARDEAPAWRETARVLGRFGPSAIDALRDRLEAFEGEPERLAWALAHVAAEGHEDAVAGLRSNGDPDALGAAAERAIAQRSDAAEAASVARGEGDTEGGDASVAFARRFYRSTATASAGAE